MAQKGITHTNIYMYTTKKKKVAFLLIMQYGTVAECVRFLRKTAADDYKKLSSSYRTHLSCSIVDVRLVSASRPH